MLGVTTHFAARQLLDRQVVEPEQLEAAWRLRSEWPTLSLTDLLLMFGMVSYARLEPVLAELHPEAPVGHQLVREGWLTAMQLDEALAVQEETGAELGGILETLGHLSRRRFLLVREQVMRRATRSRTPSWRPRLA